MNMSDLKALWSQVSGLLQSTKPMIASKQTADDFADHFRKKIDNIRDVTSNAPAAVMSTEVCHFFAFQTVTLMKSRESL